VTLTPFDRTREITVAVPVPLEPSVTVPVPRPGAAPPTERGIVDRILAKVVELTTATVGALAWRGQILKGRFFPSTASFSVGEVVLAKRIGHSSEWAVAKRVVGELVFYGIPTIRDSNGANQAELWVFDGTTHTLVYTTTEGIGPYVMCHITCIWYQPGFNYVYFAVNTDSYDDDTGFETESNELYKCNLSTYAVTALGVRASFDTLDDPWNDAVWAPPVLEAAQFQGNIYLAQMGTTFWDSTPDWIYLPPRVYKFDPVAETVVRVFIQPDWARFGYNRVVPSLAVYGVDTEILYADNGASWSTTSGKIYSSVDGAAWGVKTDLGDTDGTFNMMTDRTTGHVWIIHAEDADAYEYWLMEYDGVSFTNIVDAFPVYVPGQFGATFSGSTRLYLWGIANYFAAGGNIGVWRNDGTGWVADPMQPAMAGWGYSNARMNIASLGGQPLVLSTTLIQFGIGDFRLVLWQRADLGWTIIQTWANRSANNIWDVDGAICRVAGLPMRHEQ